MLYKLPNGNFIDPATVTGVSYLPHKFIDLDGPEMSATVRIDTAVQFGAEAVEFGMNDAGACGFRDEFAGICIEAQKEPKSPA